MKREILETAKICYKSARRLPLLWQIRHLASWSSLENPKPGYSIVIAGMHNLWPVAVANLRLISKCDRTNLREIILVLDQESHRFPVELLESLEQLRSEGLPIKLLGYDKKQYGIASRINWGWVYSWLSWSIGIANAETRWVWLHDLDAMPIDKSIFNRLSASAEREQSQFQGIRFYSGNGVTPDMRLVTTFEMVLDAQWLRSNTKPIECFNQIRLVKGRYVDFDTLLEVQRRAPLRRIEPIEESSLVHPSQLICQYTDLVSGRGHRIGSENRLPVLSYFMHLGDPSIEVDSIGDAIAKTDLGQIRLFRQSVDISKIPPSSWAWMEKQIRRLEQELSSSTRPHIENYLRGFVKRAGNSRSVGREDIACGGVPDK